MHPKDPSAPWLGPMHWFSEGVIRAGLLPASPPLLDIRSPHQIPDASAPEAANCHNPFIAAMFRNALDLFALDEAAWGFLLLGLSHYW